MAEVGQCEELIALEADVAHVIKVVFLVVDVLRVDVSLRDCELLAEVQGEDALIVDLQEYGIRAMVADLLAQWQP